jgi:hypothetical protein
MNQGALIRPDCGRNAGVFLIISTLVGSFVLFSLNTLFTVPGEKTLTAAINLKNNWLLLIFLLIPFVVLIFTRSVVAFPLNNVFKSINKDISLMAARFRIIEAVIFILSIILLFIEISFFNQLWLLGHFFYGLQLVLLGYLVYKSGYLPKILGVFLTVGGFGYLLEGIIDFYLQDLILVPTVGLIIATLAEFSLGIILVIKAMKILNALPDTKERVNLILKNLGEATTAEIIEEASKTAHDCKDRIPGVLVALEDEGKVVKKISKEKKAIVWRLAD